MVTLDLDQGAIMAMPNSAVLGLAAVIAAATSSSLIVLLWPLLRRYAVAKPNARSSHRMPTPQGGGIAVIAATIAAAAFAAFVLLPASDQSQLLIPLLAATAFIALVGAIDDIRALGVVPRLACQTAAFAAVLAGLPADLHIIPELPWWIERVLMLLGGVWFINLTNFMDGIDWITAAETLPITAGLVVLGIYSEFPLHGAVVAAALGGAILAFAPFNRPVARLFLGDVGSLPIGLLLGWLLILLVGSGHVAAAILLPLYYACDATLTLLLRTVRVETIWKAHRDHFYQRALDGGMRVIEIVARIFVANVLLAVLALATVLIPGRAVSWIALACGFAAVGLLMRSFAARG